MVALPRRVVVSSSAVRFEPKHPLDLSAAPQLNRADQETSELNSRIDTLVEVLVNRLLGPPIDPLSASTRRRAPRALGARALEQGAEVAIVSESAARRFWPGEDPLGKRLSGKPWLARFVNHDTFTVIGVVKSVRTTLLSKLEEGFVYFPQPPSAFTGLLLVRTRAAPEAVFQSATGVLAGIDATLPTRASMIPLEQGPVEIQKLMSEVPAVVASGLGVLGLLLAAVGVYGVVSMLVAQRTREIGIRIAVGAQNRDITRPILGESLRPVLWGGAIGLAGSVGIASLLQALVVMPDVPI